MRLRLDKVGNEISIKLYFFGEHLNYHIILLFSNIQGGNLKNAKLFI